MEDVKVETTPVAPAEEKTPVQVQAKAPEAPKPSIKDEAGANYSVLQEFQVQLKDLESKLAERDQQLKSLSKVAEERDQLRSQLGEILSAQHAAKVRSSVEKMIPNADAIIVDGLIARAGDLAKDPSKESELVDFLKKEVQSIADKVKSQRRANLQPMPMPRTRSFAI